MDDAESIDTLPEDAAGVEEVVTEEFASKKRKRRGPGFLLGITLGALAGAAAATMFAPPPEEELSTSGAAGVEPDLGAAAGPSDMLRSALARFRRNLAEAGAEGRQAAQEAEADMRARFNELTQS